MYFFSKGNGGSYSHTPLVDQPGCSPLRTGLKTVLEAIEKKADFDRDYPEYSKNIWRTIIDDFKNKFNVYRTS